MKRTFIKLMSLTAVMTLGFSSAIACQPNPVVKTVTPGKLTIGIYSYPPFTIISPDGKISGIDTDIVKQAAADNCLEVEVMSVAPSATIQAVISGKADVAIGSWNRTEARAKVLGISNPTYLDPMTSISKEGVDTIEGLVGKKVGSVTGYLWNADLQKLLGANFKQYQDDVAMAQDLEAGRIDVGLDGYAGPIEAQKAGKYKALKIKIVKPDQRVQASMKAPQAGVLYTKDNVGLGKAIDAAIERARKEGTLVRSLNQAGYDGAALTNVGEAWLVK